MSKRSTSIFMVTYLPTLLMNIINQATNYITGASAYDMIYTINITSLMVLASIYLSVSTSLPSTPNIKPVEVWLFFSLAYPFLVIITNVVKQVREIIINFIFTNIYTLPLRLMTRNIRIITFLQLKGSTRKESTQKCIRKNKSVGTEKQ